MPKVYVVVSAASVRVAGYLMYTLYKNRTRIRLMRLVRQINANPAWFVGGPNRKTCAFLKDLKKIAIELREAKKKAKEKSPELTEDDFLINIVRLTESELKELKAATVIVDEYNKRS